MLSHTHLGTCGSSSGIVCHFLFQGNRKTKDEASNTMKTQISLRSQHGAPTAISQQLPLGAATHPWPTPSLGCPYAQRQLPVRTQSPQQAELSQAGRGNSGTFPRVCRKELEGKREGEEEAALQANWRQFGKLPETPAQTSEKAWVIRRGLYDLTKAQRPRATKSWGSWWHVSLHLHVLIELKWKHWDHGGGLRSGI